MKKKYTLILLFTAFGVFAQNDCSSVIEQAVKTLNDRTITHDNSKVFQAILPCALAGDATGQNYIGLMYTEGVGTLKDEKKGFEFIEQAAEKGNPTAQFNLGNLYRQGKGCSLNMEKAVEWFAKAAEQKNERAAYSLGYMNMKGLGVPQDYLKAVQWYNRSSYAMAKHWLGVCYYLGLGVDQDTEKALEYFYSNKTPNSKAFLQNIESDKREKVLTKTKQEIEHTETNSKRIEPAVILEPKEFGNETATLSADKIVGQWTGKFIEYDWSGIQPQRILPIKINISRDQQGKLHSKIEFVNRTFENLVVFNNNNIFIEGFKFKLDELYTHSLTSPQLDYTILGMNLRLKTNNNITYLIADTDGVIGNWNENTPPIHLILRPAKDSDLKDGDQEILTSIASQSSDFIKVYPVPFKDQLSIYLNITEPGFINAELIDINSNKTLNITSAKADLGNNSYHVNTAGLPNGYYVIRVKEKEKIHTKIVIKQ